MRSRFGRLDIAVNNAGTEGLRGLVIENALAERGGGALRLRGRARYRRSACSRLGSTLPIPANSLDKRGRLLKTETAFCFCLAYCVTYQDPSVPLVPSRSTDGT
jgi:hypothetical protein